MQNLEHLGCRELSTEEIKCGVGHFIFGKQGGLHTVYYTAESQLKTKLFVDNILVLEGSEIKLSHEKLIAMGFEYIQEYYPEDEFDVVANDNRYVISNEFLILILYPEGVESLRALFPLPAVEIRNKKDY